MTETRNHGDGPPYFRRVRDQVLHARAERRRFAMTSGSTAGHLGFDRRTRLGNRARACGQGIGNDTRGFERAGAPRRTARLDPREEQDTLDHLGEPARFGLDARAGPFDAPGIRHETVGEVFSGRPMTDTGVRSSCDTAATNSICCRARRSARSAVIASTATLPNISSRTPKLSARLLVRAALTAASSEPARCRATRRHRVGGFGRARRACAPLASFGSGRRVVMLKKDCDGVRRSATSHLASIRRPCAPAGTDPGGTEEVASASCVATRAPRSSTFSRRSTAMDSFARRRRSGIRRRPRDGNACRSDAAEIPRR